MSMASCHSQELQKAAFDTDKLRRRFGAVVHTRQRREEQAQHLHAEMTRWMCEYETLRTSRGDVRSRRALHSTRPRHILSDSRSCCRHDVIAADLARAEAELGNLEDDQLRMSFMQTRLLDELREKPAQLGPLQASSCTGRKDPLLGPTPLVSHLVSTPRVHTACPHLLLIPTCHTLPRRMQLMITVINTNEHVIRRMRLK